MKKPFLILLLFACGGFAPLAHATLISASAAAAATGNEVGNALIERGQTDGTNGGLFVMVEQAIPGPNTSAAFGEDGNVRQWSFVGNNAAGGSYVTPFIVERFGIRPSYFVHGIGATRMTSRAAGVQTYNFDLQSGNDEVSGGGNFFFGWYDGRLDVANIPGATQNGVIEFDPNITLESGLVLYFGGAGYEGMSIGFDLSTRSPTVLPNPLSRVYSVSASLVPEPSSALLFAVGMVLLASRRRGFNAG